MSTQHRKPSKDDAPKSGRVHIIRGIPRPVVRSYYDPRQNAVVDVLQIDKTVQTRTGPREVTLFRHVYCNDDSIQAKHKKSDEVVELEVTDV